jgi:hypothetical protein
LIFGLSVQAGSGGLNSNAEATVGMARCAVPVAERSVRRRDEFCVPFVSVCIVPVKRSHRASSGFAAGADIPAGTRRLRFAVKITIKKRESS